jgi:hypothetical protein
MLPRAYSYRALPAVQQHAETTSGILAAAVLLLSWQPALTWQLPYQACRAATVAAE